MILEERGKISEDSYMEMEPISGIEIVVKDSSCHSSCLDKVLPVSSVELSLFDSSIHFPNEGFTETTSSSSDQTEDEEMASEIHTPAENVFDPFAPCGDELLLAPKKKKLRDSFAPLRRQLDFDAEDDSRENVEVDPVKEFDEEEQFFELVYNSLFEMIISSQLEEISDVAMVVDSDSLECKTPLPLLVSIAETCPLAPVRPTLTFERHRHNLCRKLEF